ncbi:MAG: hypothetical protein ACR2P7_08260 [bacterium]
MNPIFTKPVAASLGAALLAGALLVAPSASHAGWYCMKMPTYGNRELLAIDDLIPVRFRIEYEIKTERWTSRDRVYVRQPGAAYNPDNRNYGINYIRRNYNDSHFCMEMREVEIGLQDFVKNATRQNNGIEFPADAVAKITKVVGETLSTNGQCPVSRDVNENKVVKAYRRSLNNQDPWDCAGFRRNIDSPYAGIVNKHELQKKNRTALIAEYEAADVFYSGDENINWEYVLHGHPKKPKRAYGLDHNGWRNADWGAALKVKLNRHYDYLD